MNELDMPEADSATAQTQHDSPMEIDEDSKDLYRSDLIQVRPTTTAGLGLFARSFIPSGTRLIGESALISLPDTAEPPELYDAVLSLSEAQRSAFWTLAGGDSDLHKRRRRRRHDDDDEDDDDEAVWIPSIRAAYSGPDAGFEEACDATLRAWRVYETNRFTVRGGGGSGGDGSGGQSAGTGGSGGDSSRWRGSDRMGLFPRAARLNHSCRPNVFHRHNPRIARLTIHALRDIGPDEELCTSYIDVVHPVQERARILRHWGFRCACVLCATTDAEGSSEGRRTRLGEMMRRVKKDEAGRTGMVRWGAREYLEGISALEEMVGLMDEERLDESDTLGEVLGLGAEYAMALGRRDRAREWAARAVEIEERCLGKDAGEWLEAKERLAKAEKEQGQVVATGGEWHEERPNELHRH